MALTANPDRADRITGEAFPIDRDAMHLRAMPATGDFNRDSMTITAVIATAHPVARRDSRGAYMEVLDPAGLDVSGADDVPFLDSHNRTRAQATIGRAQNVRIEDGQVVADLRFSMADDVQPIVQRVQDGTLSKFSAGYAVRKWRESVENGVRTRTAVDWSLIEVSLVSIPADPNCQKRGKSMALDDTNDRAALIEEIRSALALPEEWATRMAEAEGELTDDEIRESAREELLKRQKAAPKIRVHGGNDDPAQIATRQADAVAFRMAGGELPPAAREFVGMSLRDLAADALQRAGQSTRGLSADEIFTRAAVGTSDFPLLVSNAMNKVALDSYRAAESPLKALARQRTLPNFKESTSIRLGEMGRLEEMTEHGEFTHTSRAESGEKMSLKTFGRAINVSRKLLIDDDLNMLGDMTSAIGAAAAQSEAEELVATFTGNPVLSDGNAVFHASRGNLAASGVALGSAGDLAAIDAARKAMRTVKGLDGKTIIGVQPKYLVVGPESETAAEQILASIYAATKDDVNAFSGKLQLVVEPRITGPGWFVMAEPSRVPALQYAYLSAAQGVQIQRQEAWTTLGLQYRAFLDFGTGWVDWRGAYFNPGA